MYMKSSLKMKCQANKKMIILPAKSTQPFIYQHTQGQEHHYLMVKSANLTLQHANRGLILRILPIGFIYERTCTPRTQKPCGQLAKQPKGSH